MPYEITQDVLDELIVRALQHEEIEAKAEQAGLNKGYLRSQLKEKASEISAAAAKEIEAYNRRENDYRVLASKIGDSQEERLRENRKGVLLQLVRNGLIASAIVVLLLYVLLLLAVPVIQDFTSLAFLLISGAIVTAVLVASYRRVRGAYADHAARLEAILRGERELKKLEEELRSAEQEIKRQTIDKGMLPELRSLINANLAPSYDTNLTQATAPGLAEVFNPEYEVDTEAKARLSSLLSIMPGGSIGIAGPRGSGKSTVMRYFCSGQSFAELNGRPVLSIMIPAPVKYEAREFILHIYSSICQRLLELKGGHPRSPWKDVEDAKGTESSAGSFFLKVVNFKEALVLLGLGLVVLLGLVVAGMLFSSDLIDDVLGPHLRALKINPSLISHIGLLLVALGLLGLLIEAARQTPRMLRVRRKAQLLPEDDPDKKIVEDIHQRLSTVRFQQTYSSG